MKFLIGLLILANGLLFVYQKGYFGMMGDREPERMKNQVGTEKIKLISASESEKSIEKTTCLEVAGFLPQQAQEFETQLENLKLSNKMLRQSANEVSNYMVYVLPQTDQLSAKAKTSELQELGISNFFIIQENSNLKWGISLGIFKTEEAASNYIANLKQRGLKDIDMRRHSTPTNQVSFQFRELDSADVATVKQATAKFPERKIHQCQ